MVGLVVDIALREILIFAALALLTIAILATDDDSGTA